MLSITDLTVEHQRNVLGIDEKCPRFSWVLGSDQQNVLQKTYRITVHDQKGELCWDSGTMHSETSVLVPYGGKNLVARCVYSVKISVSDNFGEQAEAGLSFETGLFGGKNLQGQFIAAEKEAEQAVPMFFTDFKVSKNIRRARLYATALGVYEVFINNKRVGDMYDAPFWTSYKYTLQYQTYDVTEYLRQDNRIEALVANGWYKGEIGYYRQKNIYGDKAAFCCDLIVTYEDGTTERVSSDLGWKCRSSAIRASEFYDGEYYDSTFADYSAQNVIAVDYDKNRICAQISEPVRVTQRLPAQRVLTTPMGETVVDFGQNLTGVVEFSYRGERGEKIVLSYAEVLDKEGNFYRANLRTAKSRDIFILNGEKQTLVPHFTWHGFRYLRVEGNSSPVTEADFCALVLHSDMKKTGTFSCSDKRVERLYENIVWGQRGNFFDIPSDCPQRDERLGWTGDAQAFCRTATYNYNVFLFFKKWLADLKAEQTPEKGVPHIVPNVIAENARGAAFWGDAATIIPWTMYFVYGDKRILEDQYTSMRDWVEYIRGMSNGYLWKSGFQYGDWLALDKEENSDRTGATDKYLIASAFYALSVRLLKQTAEVLQKEEDAAYYGELYKKIVRAFQKEYVTATGRIVGETQTSFVLLLHFDLIQKKFRAAVAERLRQNLAEHKNHLVTGFVGTPYLCHALTENGLHDLAAALLFNDDYPSWLYEVKMGATTVWERWNGIEANGDLYDPGMNSFNHYAYGSVGDWLFRKVAGIDCLAPGYKKISVRPYPIAELFAIEASYLCPYGKISVSYHINGDAIDWSIEIPVNTRAEICLPGARKRSVGSGVFHFTTEAKFCTSVKREKKERFEVLFRSEKGKTLLKEELSEPLWRQLRIFGGTLCCDELLSKYPHIRPNFDLLYNALKGE